MIGRDDDMREHIVVCVDDTDDLSKRTSTGAVAEALARCVAAHGGVVELGITRHQLLLDPRVRYTSHNSAMAFTAWVPHGVLPAFACEARGIVRSMRAATSDPGLAYGVVPEPDDAWRAWVLEYGFAAQQRYLTVGSAFELAASVPWLELESLGGNRDGVVGALAGVGLRLSGADGRFRGKRDLSAAVGGCQYAAARDVVAALERQAHGDVVVCDSRGRLFMGDEPVALRPDVKPVLWHGSMAVVVEERDGVLWPLAKAELDAYDSRKDGRVVACRDFVFDNDREEFLGFAGEDATCANCLYRRLTANGYTCMRERAEAVA